MPVDTSKTLALNVSRRQFRKVSTEEEIELKRARGEISCAECRRLKLKCDKKLPCGSCVRRGCPTICPNGSLSTGQGTRFVLADTEHLHRKIAEMGHRIRALEDALGIFQTGVSSDAHPLLTDELLAIKYGLESSPREAPTDQQSLQLDGLGTLTITERGDSHYFGRTAGSEAGAEMSGTDPGSSVSTDELPPASSEIRRLASILPFNIAGISDDGKQSELLDALLDLLPEYPRATTLCETYLENAAWVFRPITREELIDEILSPVYAFSQDRKKNLEGLEVNEEISSHTVAVLYMVFAHGALTDLTLPPYNSEAEDYFHLARLALSLQPVYDLPTSRTLQALVLLAYYYANSGRHPTLDSAWSIISFANKLAQSMGLHRDPARFHMPPKAIQRRRMLFWELLSADMFHSIAMGRPPSISLSYVDCEFPEDPTTTVNNKGVVEMGFFHWKYAFTRDIFIPVLESTLTATPPTYETILELDRKIRERALHLHSTYTAPVLTTSTLHQLRLSRVGSYSSLGLLQCCTYTAASSLRLSAYRCASAIIKTIALNFQKYPELFARFWTMWSHLLSAAIIVGTIITRSPSSTMAPAARLELDLALNLFKSGAAVSPRAKNGLAVLMHLKDKAEQAQGQLHSDRADSLAASPAVLLPETGVDELAVFGGQTKILVSKILSQQSRRKGQSTSSLSPSTASSPSAISEDSPTHSDSIPDCPSITCGILVDVATPDSTQSNTAQYQLSTDSIPFQPKN
ncbi:hypothetical protein JVU11DRAFT_1775 [Chiua virens]|nr:hypothetical protein JVU11DRAFT_1775 [Chiua virens]